MECRQKKTLPTEQPAGRKQIPQGRIPWRAQKVKRSEAEEQTAGRLLRSNPLDEGSREKHKIMLWTQGQHKRGHLAGRMQKDNGSPEREEGARCARRRVGSSEGQPAAQRDAMRPHCLLVKSSRDSPPDGTNLHVPPLTAVGRVPLESRGGRGRAERRARLHGTRGATVRPLPLRPLSTASRLVSGPPSGRQRQSPSVSSPAQLAGASRFLALHSLPGTRQRIPLLLTFSPFHPHYSHRAAPSFHRVSTGTLLCSPGLI